VRPKETDLIALLQTGHLDFLFIYSSIAVQHKLNYILLPDEINLSNHKFDAGYNQATTQIRGRKPHELNIVSGEAIIYGLTIPNDAPNKTVAARFVAFILSKPGQEILSRFGHRKLEKIQVEAEDLVPEIIRRQLSS
jgi:molybdate/tungstate transport system substrate-binding protein